jgi:NRAMP (natural resistance-associated macrophage protein)-like metal ion transporter
MLWPILISVLATIVLQALAARIGILTGYGLGDAIREVMRGSPWLVPLAVLIISALGVGNAAYQTGNIAGAASGLVELLGGNRTAWSAAIVVVSLLLVSLREYRWLQRVLIALVVMLSVTFLVSATISLRQTQLSDLIAFPQIDSESLTLVLALIGTTIVPYNLFLHSSSAASNWQSSQNQAALNDSFWDTFLSVSLGGLVTAAILLTASAAFFVSGEKIESVSSIARQLTPTLGTSAGLLFSAGLFAAGLTSAVTAPLATAYAVSGILGWQAQLGNWRFRSVAYLVIIAGGYLAVTAGQTPVQVIVFAQLTNGLLLPIAACLVIWISVKVAAFQSLPVWWLTLAIVVTCLISGLAIIKIVQLLSSF